MHDGIAPLHCIDHLKVWSGAAAILAYIVGGSTSVLNTADDDDDDDMDDADKACVGIACLLGKELAAQIPSLLWLAPRAGAGASNYSYSKTDVLVTTPDRNYTAFTLDALLKDVGFSKKVPEYEFLASEPDLDLFAPPMVNTFVTYV